MIELVWLTHTVVFLNEKPLPGVIALLTDHANTFRTMKYCSKPMICVLWFVCFGLLYPGLHQKWWDLPFCSIWFWFFCGFNFQCKWTGSGHVKALYWIFPAQMEASSIERKFETEMHCTEMNCWKSSSFVQRSLTFRNFTLEITCATESFISAWILETVVERICRGKGRSQACYFTYAM